MSLLNPSKLFNIAFGGGEPHDTSSYLQNFTPASTVSVALTAGEVVEVVSEGGEPRVDRLTYAAVSTTLAGPAQAQIQAVIDAMFTAIQGKKKARVVVEGNTDDEAGSGWSGTVNTICGEFVYETDVFTAGTYIPGDILTVDAGVPLKAVGTTRLPFGEVVEYDADSYEVPRLTIAVRS